MSGLWLAAILSIVLTPAQQEASIEVTFCNFQLPGHVKQVNASFNVSYAFQVDDNGRPAKMQKLIDDYVGEKAVASCLESWRFSGIKRGVPIVAVFRWQHGEGWVALTITGPAFSQKIKLTGERCPYPRMQLEKTKNSVEKKRKS